MDKDIIESIEASLWSLQENLDHTCNLLSTTLPKIHMDLQRTHSKASRTLDLIKTTDSPGKIGTITDKLRQVYQSALVHIEDLCEQDSLVLHHARRALALFHRKESDSLNSPGMQEAFALCDALSEQIKQIIPAEKAYITDMDALFQENISRLKDALNNITLIFRDLAQRCEATDLPIHNIMTSLQ
ncbi:MAG: hypothetical protein U9P80_05055, partial [Thermodesulfobacteriota bacterium]|nr:hypothetical protein [Thermodesulfobacteriota bacterium]